MSFCSAFGAGDGIFTPFEPTWIVETRLLKKIEVGFAYFQLFRALTELGYPSNSSGSFK